ncbi:Mediator of RNA polymerase II transcription subunit 21 [Schistosoma japonicum]|nr:Mediator of RNA polymerase II transcription subunit 21 [Schistosoma japonicum]
MSSIPVTELDLLSALQAVGALNKSDETSRLFESKSTLNDAPMGTASSIWSDSFPIFERSESLRIIHNLVEGLLRVQTRDSSTATRHLGVVLSSLFRFLSDSNSDVRIAADEDIARSFTVAISATAKQLDTLIGALPEEEASADIQRATVYKLLEGYRTERAKLARITTKLESRLAEVLRCLRTIAQTQLTTQSLESENYMELNSNPSLSDPSLKAPESIYLSSTSSPSHDSWLTHLTILFLLMLFFRLRFTFGVVNRLHDLVNYILMISTPSGRKRQALRAKYVEDLDNLRNQLKSAHMMVRQFSIYVELYAIEALSIAYLISRSPEKSISPETIQSILKTDHFMKHYCSFMFSNILYSCKDFSNMLGYSMPFNCRTSGDKTGKQITTAYLILSHNMNTTPTYSTTSNTSS